jgi:hypothetical protein
MSFLRQRNEPVSQLARPLSAPRINTHPREKTSERLKSKKQMQSRFKENSLHLWTFGPKVKGIFEGQLKR